MNLPYSLFRWRQIAPQLLAFIGAVTAVCAYLQALNYPFFGDDVIYVVKNQKLAGLQLGELWRVFTEPYNRFTEFLPLREISYWFDLTLFGLEPAAFRIHNILLYLLCLPLVYGMTTGVWRYFRPEEGSGAPWIAAVVTALFAVHPSHVEAVVWIAGRKDVLAAVFSLLALWLAIRARQEQALSPAHAAATLIALVAAMLSKATAAAIAPVIALLWSLFWLDTPKQARRPLLLLWPLAGMLLALGFALIFSSFMQFRAPFYFGIEAVTRSLAALGWLARLAVSPEDRHYFYPVFEDPHLNYMVVLGAAVLVAAVIGGIWVVRKRSLTGFALLVFFLLCAPSMQLIPYAPPSLISDRFLAIAVWPAILVIVAWSWRLKPLVRMGLLLVFAVAWTAQTAKHPLDWRSVDVLVENELRAYPGYAMPVAYKIFNVDFRQGSYGAALASAGSIADPRIRNAMIKLVMAHQAVQVESASTGNAQKAMVLLSELRHALKERPVPYAWDPSVYNLWQTIDFLFEAQWRDLVQRFPDDALVHYNAGLWMVDDDKYVAAIPHLRAASESPRLPESLRGTAFEKLGLALLATGYIEEAESSLLAALKQPQVNERVHCLLAMLYKQTGRPEEAARSGTQCLGARDSRN